MGSDVLTVDGVAPVRFVVMESTVLVLGASGQVGTAVVGAFLRDGWRVRAGARRRHLWPEGSLKSQWTGRTTRRLLLR